MQNSSLIEILKILSPDEISSLKQFLKSPYFNRNRNCEKLFSILCQYYPTFTSPKLDAEKLFYRIFGKEKSYRENAANFRTLVSHLKKCVNQFLIVEELEGNNAQRQLLLLDAYSKRRGSGRLIQEVSKKNHQAETSIGPWYFLNRFLLYWKLYQEATSDFFSQEAAHFDDLNENLDDFYLMTKLKLGIERTNLVKRGTAVSPLNFIPTIQSFIQQKEEHLPTILVLYAKLYDLTSNTAKDTNDFKAVFDLFKSVIQDLTKEEAKEIAAILYNFSNAKIKQHTFTAIYKLLRFEVLQLSVEEGLYFENDLFPSSMFMNIAVSAVSVGEFKWAITFIDTYSQFLSKDLREMNLNVTKGVFYYLKGHKNKNAADYKKSVQFLEAIKTRIKSFNNLKIWVLLKAHYEHFILAGDLTIFKYTDNFHILISRSAYLEKDKRSFLNTNNTIKYLIKSRHEPNLSLSKVKTRIAKFKAKRHYNPEWINAQMEEFLKFRFPDIVFD